MFPRQRPARTAAVGYLVLGAVHLLAQLVSGREADSGGPAGAVVGVTQWLLMPLLATAFVLQTRQDEAGGAGVRLTRLVSAALALSWLGDAAPDLASGDTAFLIKVGFFLIAQLTYIAAFLPYRADSVVMARRWWLLGYPAAIAGLIVACAPHAGSLLVPVLIYGACLGTMAVLATGVDRLTGVGGAVFLISDALIALQQFVPGLVLPAGAFWVMASYLLAQALIVLGVLRRVSLHTRTSSGATTSS